MRISRLFLRIERTRSLIHIIVLFFSSSVGLIIYGFNILSATCGDSGVTNYCFTLVQHIQPNLEWDPLREKLTNLWNKPKRRQVNSIYLSLFI